MEKVRKQIVEIIKRSDRILVMPSAPPDGDSLGSSLALYLALKKLGKEVTVCMAEPVPEAYQFLPTTRVISNEFTANSDFIVTLDCSKAKLKTIHSKVEPDKVNIILTAKSGQFSEQDVSFNHGPSRYDLIITVDTGGLEQLGKFYEDNTELFTSIPLINIDHHASNDLFGRINYVDIMSSSTTQMIMPLIHDFEHETGVKLMDEDIATLLLAGIITDTGSFQHSNTSPSAFAAAAQLIKYGARQQEIIQNVFKTKHLSTLRLWGRILSNIRVDQKHNFVWSVISRKDFRDTASKPEESGEIIDELLTNAPGTEVVLLLKQRDDGLITGSLRSTTDSLDVSHVAGMFGGGGHVRAAGFRIKSEDIHAVEKMVVEKIKEFQKKRLNINDDLDVELTTLPPVGSPDPMLEQRVTSMPKAAEVAAEVMDSSVHAHVTMANPVSEENALNKDPALAFQMKQSGNNTNKEEHQAENFTDVIVRKAPATLDKPIEILPGLTYKFEE